MPIKWFDQSPDPGLPECICSVCARPIEEDAVPMRAFRSVMLEARFCPDCFATARPELEQLQTVSGAELAARIVKRFGEEVAGLPYSIMLNRLGLLIVEELEGAGPGEPVEEPLPGLFREEADSGDASEVFGPCCACGRSGPTVRNFVFLEKRAPIPGTGWGCVRCGAPNDGAVAVLCDHCLATGAEIKEVCCGRAVECNRMPVELLSEPFGHDFSKHPEYRGDYREAT